MFICYVLVHHCLASSHDIRTCCAQKLRGEMRPGVTFIAMRYLITLNSIRPQLNFQVLSPSLTNPLSVAHLSLRTSLPLPPLPPPCRTSPGAASAVSPLGGRHPSLPGGWVVSGVTGPSRVGTLIRTESAAGTTCRPSMALAGPHADSHPSRRLDGTRNSARRDGKTGREPRLDGTPNTARKDGNTTRRDGEPGRETRLDGTGN